jgi:hypothetical protein
MKNEDFPALHRSANTLSLDAQRHFFTVLKLHLSLLCIGAALSAINFPYVWIAVAQVFALLGALFCSIYLFAKRPDRLWYAGRAVAESVKTITWRFVTKTEPFDTAESVAQHDFRKQRRDIVEQNREVAQSLTSNLTEVQITDAMNDFRNRSLEERKELYRIKRITDQLDWYAKKSSFNRKTSSVFFCLLVATNGAAVIAAVVRINFLNSPVWCTDTLIAIAASLLSWMQAKRYSELASSYALTAHEISLIREQSLVAATDNDFSLFVGDAENAFSREHTQWIARRDV